MKTKFNKLVIANYSKYLDGEQFEVIVVLDKYSWDGKGYSDEPEGYYNVHVISERFKSDELNTLKLQEPVSCVPNPKEYFSLNYMIGTLMEHFIWDRFCDEGIVSASVIIHEIEEH
jgi:hypothetical protein